MWHIRFCTISILTHVLHCNEDVIYVFFFWEQRGLSPNFHIQVSVAIYIFPGSVYVFPEGEQAGRSWEYINRSQAHECENWDCGRAIPNLGLFSPLLRIFVSNFPYCFFAVCFCVLYMNMNTRSIVCLVKLHIRRKALCYSIIEMLLCKEKTFFALSSHRRIENLYLNFLNSSRKQK